MGFVIKKHDDIAYYTLPEWEKQGALVAVSCRTGGVSRSPRDSLNLALHVGDDPEDVLTNRQKFFAALGLNLQDIVCMQQIHGNNVGIITEKERGRGAFDHNDALPETDGLITAVPGLPIVEFSADCVPVFLFDPRLRVIAVCHAGWKGTAAGIPARTLQLMQRTFGTEPKDCLAAIGPSIGPCHFRVDSNVIRQFEAEGFAIDQLLSRRENIDQPEESGYLDLWEANRSTLLRAGMNAEDIIVSDICTYCHQERLFSYRAADGVTGRLAAVAVLR